MSVHPVERDASLSVRSPNAAWRTVFPRPRLQRALPTTLLAVLAGLVATHGRWGADWPAQEFRAWSARYAGLTTWTNRWYSGQALPGYSVLYPVVSAWLGAAVTGFVAVGAVCLAAPLLAPPRRLRRVAFEMSVGAVVVADLLIGQVPYLLGLGFAAWALVAVGKRRRFLAGVLAACCALASPLAGVFVLVATPALVARFGWRDVVPLGLAGIGLVTSAAFGGASGPAPFVTPLLIAILAFAAVLIGCPVRMPASIRLFGVTYAVIACMSYLEPNPVGGNIARLGELVALPLLWHWLPPLRRSPRVTALWVLPLVVLSAGWSLDPAVIAGLRGVRDPSRQASYFRGLNRFLSTQDPLRGRAEVVFTRSHWEALFVAQVFPIARGWERQTDMAADSVLYGPLSADSYRRWLDDNAVALVALPDVALDGGGKAEAALLRHPPQYLRPVWHDRHIRVWAVLGGRPLVSGPAVLRELGPASLVLDFQAAGRATVRVRGSNLWTITAGEGCVTDRGGWLTVTTTAASSITVRSRVTTTMFDANRCS